MTDESRDFFGTIATTIVVSILVIICAGIV